MWVIRGAQDVFGVEETVRSLAQAQVFPPQLMHGLSQIFQGLPYPLRHLMLSLLVLPADLRLVSLPNWVPIRLDFLFH